MQQEIITSLSLSQTKDTLLLSTQKNLKLQTIKTQEYDVIIEKPSTQSCFYENFIISLNNDSLTIFILENKYVPKLEIKKSIVNKNFNAFSIYENFEIFLACEDEIIKIKVNPDFTYKYETYYKCGSEITALKVCKNYMAVAIEESLLFIKEGQVVKTYEMQVYDIDSFSIGDVILFAAVGVKTHFFENLDIKNEFDFSGDCVRFSQSGMCFCVSNNETIKSFGLKSDGSVGEIEMEKLE